MVKKCPQCQSHKVISIMYGMPTMEAFEEAEEGKLIIGGCCIDQDSPSYHCQACGHEFGRYFEVPDLKDSC